MARLTFWLLACCLTGTYAQSATKSVPQIIFKDRVFASILRAYINQRKAKAVRINIAPADKGYKCHLIAASYYENIADHSATSWAQWQNCLLIFDADSSRLAPIGTIIQPADRAGLLVYLQQILPDNRTPIPKGDKTEHFRYRGVDEWGWVFIIDRGREVWFSIDGGYDSQSGVPDSLPAVPEANRKP